MKIYLAMKLYLALPFTGMEEESFKEANKMAGHLMSLGHIVFSPISHSWPIAQACKLPEDWDYWKQFDTAFIEWCDSVYVLRLAGWEKSKGVTAEIKIAKDLGKSVVYI